MIPIPVWPWPVDPERLALIRAAKASLSTDQKITLVEANPGAPGRVLSFAGRPPHVCQWAPIRPENHRNVASIAAALEFVMGDSGQRWDEAAWLSDVMGVEVREVAA
jgi:hypothetical protein